MHSKLSFISLANILSSTNGVFDNGIVFHWACSSSIVQKALVDAHKAGKQFRVIVVDSRPKLEGR